ncbi:hypothetical protein [Dactylosporangium sp. NPDC048998]|uniref:hypothetical protein n=1 Tax=Dactylosporangium sp. NPDC048998 TaxID=3363976 RepID=UPI0037228D79
MLKRSAVLVHGPAPGWSQRPEGVQFAAFRSTMFLVLFLAIGTVTWQHWLLGDVHGSLLSHAPYFVLDLILTVPAAAASVWLVDAGDRLLRRRRGGVLGTGRQVARASAIGVVLAVLYVPLATVQALGRTVIATAGGHQHDHAGSVATGGLPYGGLVGLLRDAAGVAVQVEVAILMLALIGVVVVPAFAAELRRAAAPAHLVWSRSLATGMVVAASVFALPAADAAAAGRPEGCGRAPQRTYNVTAIDLDIVVDRFGDHDPYGYMYVLNDRLSAVRAQEAALHAASSLPEDDPSAAKVSIGLGQDPIQPLVLRARLGECVVINLTNKLTRAPLNGLLGNPPIAQPGGIPSVSIDMAGVSYDAAAGDGGQAVGNNPTSVMAEVGQTKQYRYYLDPTMGEGAKVFRSGGDSTQLTAHGLFGTLIAEPAGSRWYDPVTGVERTTDATWSNWEAMIKPGAGTTFREFTIIYHEVGDENFNLRRPLRQNTTGIPIGGDPGTPVGDQVQLGRPLPMLDIRPPTASQPDEGGGATNSYRPGSRAINYRSESFYRRLQLDAGRGADAQQADKSLAYSSYTFGDPATPMPRSYLGEPTKTRLVQAGQEQLHVHHVHGGGTRWTLDDGAGDTDLGGGLSKEPLPSTDTIQLDSQTVSPFESYTLDHACGAGGCQQAAGDFLYHCHIAHHYIAGMWGLWRVYDTAQPDLAKLPGREAAPSAVNSAGLLGRTIEGKTVVLQAGLTNPQTQVALEQLVENALPPQGTRWNDGSGPDTQDATVWDWLKRGTAAAPVYLGEPDTTAVWANYRSSAPGARPEILFNPVTGRPAYPLLKPHLGMRPPFAPNGHAGAPGVGDTATARHRDGLCPQASRVDRFNVTAISVPFQETARETDNKGEIYVLTQDKDAVLAGTKPVEPLAIRSNVGDCIAVNFGSELNPSVQSKVNMHTHLVQFDPLASDGVVAGFAFEQSVYAASRDNRTLASVDAPNRVTVSNVDHLRPGISIGVGVARTSIEVKKIVTIAGNQLTFDSDLANPDHTAGEPVSVEFVQYRWYSDVDSGTVFWHDHVNAIYSWAHGLFAAHIIEPKGSTYHDPKTGAQVTSGTQVDIHTTGSVGAGQSGSFREFVLFLHNGRRGRGELNSSPQEGLNPFNPGQECEEGDINLRAAPLGERTPPGATPANPTTTMQRQEFNGANCRNAFSRAPDIPNQLDANTVRATVTTVDPYVFSSVKYGDPSTPLLRAYTGDPVVVRTIGVGERAEALRIQGHRFRTQRFNADGELTDTATTGISERFDYVLDGGAGAPGDYLYYSARTFALESGAWGIFRAHDTLQGDLKPLPGRPAPATGVGFPRQVAATGNTQQVPGPDPASAYRPDGTVNTDVVTSTVNPCPTLARRIDYDVSLINQALPTSPYQDTGGVVYALTSDVAAVRAGTKALEPLVLRADKGDCVRLTLRNQTTAGSLYGGTNAGLDLAKLVHNPQLSSGAAIGLNPDSTVTAGRSVTYTYYADKELGTSLFQNLGSTASLRHGAYGMLIVEPAGSTWTKSADNTPLGPTATSTQAIIRLPNGTRLREFALTMQTTDQQFSRSVQPYVDVVAGSGVNQPQSPLPFAPVPGAPPGTADHSGPYDKAYNSVNYRTEPLTQRLGLTANVNDYTTVNVVGSYGSAFSSNPYGEPRTPVFQAYAHDPVVFRVGVGASDQFHSFAISGHAFRMDPRIRKSAMISTRTIGAGETMDACIASAGGQAGNPGDYLYQDARQAFTEAGIWGIFRVRPRGAPGGPAPL